MAKTLAQTHADKQLEDAVKRTVEAYDLLPAGHSVVEFLTIIEGIAINAEDEDGVMPESISLAFRNGTVRTSVAKGLVQMASEVLTSDYARQEED